MNKDITEMQSQIKNYDDTLHQALQVAVATLGEILNSPYPKSAAMADAGLDKINKLFHQHREQEKKAAI